jgi:hypothetical protein
VCVLFSISIPLGWLPLWPCGQSPWLQIQRSWTRILALPDFLGNSEWVLNCVHLASWG